MLMFFEHSIQLRFQLIGWAIQGLQWEADARTTTMNTLCTLGTVLHSDTEEIKGGAAFTEKENDGFLLMNKLSKCKAIARFGLHFGFRNSDRRFRIYSHLYRLRELAPKREKDSVMTVGSEWINHAGHEECKYMRLHWVVHTLSTVRWEWNTSVQNTESKHMMHRTLMCQNACAEAATFHTTI